MIIYNLANIFLNIFISIFNSFELPSFPDAVIEIFDVIIGLFTTGFAILNIFINTSYVMLLLELVVFIELALLTYRGLMFIIRKVPFLGIK